MALINSSWKITLGSITLLDFDEVMNDEPSLSRTNPIDIAAALTADNPSIYLRGNVSHELSFSRVKILDSDNEARAFLITHAMELPFDATHDCTIYLLEGSLGITAVLANAVLQSGGYNSRTEADWFIADYRILGGEITMTP